MDENPIDMASGDPKDSAENTTSQSKPRVRDLFVWKSLSHPARTYSREVFTVFGAVALLVSIIFAFFQEWLAIVVSWAALFMFWALSKHPPVEVEHKITTEGLISMNHAYLWVELGPFWFTKRTNETTLNLVHRNLFGRLLILINEKDQEKIKEILAEYLPYIEVPEKSTSDKLSDWFSKKFPLQAPNKI